VIRILNLEAENYSPAARNILRSIGELDELQLSRKELLDCISKYDVLIVRFGLAIDSEIINAGSRLKIIASPVTGLDHIDVQYAQSKGIRIVSLKGETAFLESIPATAEHTWALLLSLIRRIPAAFAAVCSRKWDRNHFRGHELKDKSLGLVGLGRVGRKVARFGLAFEMHVAAFDPYNPAFPPGIDRCKTLEELLRQSDVISLHVPLTEETSGMLGSPEFAILKPGVFLINTSRGQVIDETALLEALRSGTVGGAALDFVSDDKLVEFAGGHTTLLITPHLGGATVESMEKTEIFIAKRLRALL
jgi:D-3-phosphoglycerate dehydrogenase